MNNWIRFFLGTPQRFLRTGVAVGLVVVMINPGLLQTAFTRLVAELSPVIGQVIMIAVVWFAIKKILGIK